MTSMDSMNTINDKLAKLFIFTTHRLDTGNTYKTPISLLLKRCQKHSITYEYITPAIQFVHPYLDIDVDDTITNIDLMKFINDFMNTLNNLKLSYSIAGYTNNKDISSKYQFLEVKQYKQLSMHMVLYGLSIDRVYLLDYIKQTFKDILHYNDLGQIIDLSVLKGTLKNDKNKYAEQKMRLVFCNKENDNKGVNNVLIHDVKKNTDNIININNIEYINFVKCLCSAIVKGQEVDITKYKACYELNDGNKKKTIIEFDDDDVIIESNGKIALNNKENNNIKDDGNKNAKVNENNKYFVYIPIDKYFRYFNKYIEVGKYNEVLYSNDTYKQGYPFIPTLVANCPYTKHQILIYLYKWYNSIQHNHPEAINEFINNNYKHVNNNIYISLLFKAIKPIRFIDTLNEEDKEEYYEYKYLRNQNNDKINHSKRKTKKELANKFDKLKEAYINKLTDDDKVKKEDYKKFNKLFIFYGILSVNIENEEINKYNYKYLLFKDKHDNYYMKYNDEVINKNKADLLDYDFISRKVLTKLPIIEISDYYKQKNILRCSEADNENCDEFIDKFKTTFENDDDAVYYLKWLGMKLRNPNDVIGRNIVCVGDSGTFKTMLIDKLYDYLDIHKVDLIKDLSSNFNGWMLCQLVVFDEVPKNNQKLTDTCQNTLKQITSTDRLYIREKYEKTTRDVVNKANIIINSNYQNCGDIFRNQSESFEMFRRFRIMKRVKCDIENKNYIYNKLINNKFVYSLVHYLKTLKPLTFAELSSDSKYMEWYYNYATNVEENYKVLTASRLKSCVKQYRKQQYINLQELCYYLNEYNLNFKPTGLKNILMEKSIIDYINKRAIVLDINKLIDLFVETDSKEDDITTSEDL